MKLIRKLIYPITIIIILIITIGIIFTKKYLKNNEYQDIVIENEIIKEELKEEPEIIKYNIDIKGAVNKPGVYTVDNTYNVNDVIKLAGGLTKNADTSLINLAKKVKDEMVIIIYTKEEVAKSNIVKNVIKVVEKECICPNIENDGCLNDKIDDTITNTNNQLININTASKEELETISGLGESKANNIIKYREEFGKFNSIEDIKNVTGIGDTLYEKIKIYITT